MTTLSSLFSNYDKALPWLEHRVILCGLVGSWGYDTYTEESDWDYRGICIPPKEYILGNLHVFSQSKFTGENIEVTIFNIKKFFSLAVDCNPNILELLFLDEYIPLPKFQSKFMKKLLDIRKLFLSKKAKYTFGGYAFSQLKRMETHRKWLLHPPSHKPTREEFGLSLTSSPISKDELGSIEAMEKKGEDITSLYSEEILNVYSKERKYSNKKREWDQFINWEENRNKERAALEKKCGYDSKHASHLIRLLSMGIEILNEGKFQVKRTWDRDMLMKIRNGGFSYEGIMEQVEKLENLLEQAHKNSSLPESPPREHIDSVLIEILEEAYYGWK